MESRRGHTGPRDSVDRTQAKHLRQHELDTAERLAALGDHVRFIPASSDARHADVEIAGIAWELKSPTSSNRNTVITRLGRGARQSANIVFDISRTPLSIANSIEIARDVLQRYPEVAVVRLTGRGALDVAIGR